MQCAEIKGLKINEVKLAYSEEELIQHYKMTFLVHFRDGISPILYGSIYHFDFDQNFFCMALPNGSIASFYDHYINGKSNVIQEICYPIKTCEIYSDNFILRKMN